MSIETEITRISTNVSDTLSAVSEMGGEVPEGATSNDMAAGVRSIPVGAKIDDTTPSSTTTYSSQKIELELSALNEANAAQDKEIAKKANDVDLAAVAKSGSYNDLTGKPTIPTVPSALPNPNALTFTGAVNETYDGSAAKSVSIPTIPESLKNPNKLILSGAVTAEYDGSAPVSVEIPSGGGSTYELPIASPTTLGGVMPAAKTDEMTQAVGVDEAGGLWTAGAASEGDWKTKTIMLDEPVSSVVIDVTGAREVYIFANLSLNDADNSQNSGNGRGVVSVNGKRAFFPGIYIRQTATYQEVFAIRKIGKRAVSTTTGAWGNGYGWSAERGLSMCGNSDTDTDTIETIDTIEYFVYHENASLFYTTNCKWEVFYR